VGSFVASLLRMTEWGVVAMCRVEKGGVVATCKVKMGGVLRRFAPQDDGVGSSFSLS